MFRVSFPDFFFGSNRIGLATGAVVRRYVTAARRKEGTNERKRKKKNEEKRKQARKWREGEK